MDAKIRVSCLLILAMFSGVSSDFAQDKKECQNQLISLTPCLNFVSGKAKSPSATCCAELSKDLGKSTLCLCILVKDRNEPGLGFKLNTTLALSLPSICHVKSNTNATVCPDLLHLAPNSPEAQVFEQFANISGSSTSPGGNIISSNTNVMGRGIGVGALLCTMISVLMNIS